MAEVKLNHDSIEWQIFRDFYELSKKHLGVEDSDEYWQQVIKDGHDFTDKYENHALAVQLNIALQSYLETVDMTMRHGRVSEMSEAER